MSEGTEYLQIYSLIKVAIRNNYPKLIIVICDKFDETNDEYLTPLLKYLRIYIKDHDGCPAFSYFVDRYQLFQQIPDLADKDEGYFTSFLHDYITGQNVQNARVALAEVSTLLVEDPEEAKNRIKELSEILAMSNRTASPETLFSLKTPIMEIYRHNIEQGGILYGIQTMDDHVRGLKPGTMHTIFGFVGAFKSTTALSMAYYNVMTLEADIAFVSLEMPKYYLKYMLLSRHSLHPKFQGILEPIFYKDIFDGVLTPEDEKNLEILDADFKESCVGNLYMFDLTDFHMENFEEYFTGLPIVFSGIFVDYAQLMGFVNSKFDKITNINRYVKMFHDFTKTYKSGKGFTGIMLSQANRDGWKRARKAEGRYELTAISEANEIERSSFSVTALYADDALTNQGVLSLQLLKFRGGAVLLDPIRTFVDPRCCVVGDVIEVDHEAIVDGLLDMGEM